MYIVNRLKRSLANRNADVFLRAEFESLGSPAQISRALTELQHEGVLVKLGVGVYAKAKPSVLSGKPIPVKPLEILAPEILKKLGVEARPSRQAREYNAGISTQVPSGIVINTGKRRIQRKLGFNGKLVQYERT
ncbi:DUF6088 family protein [Diaphorobacter aerolatus]|uniref:Type IV toxin-antitoxin system AbiEi family antitoxin domain-containing protein n=1 Tax=Diaphorobacter aerolatus TaxID=1288495 RepID=A0A7H0GG30_9BURK|nr:DUF6088 family protein [Diaphorobacter aerolatus]QNP47246.1 type IV toxin-antitoxin system AbiEi family antitoxin domain-containing protein [Diaphorobacter aerolatus]